MHRRMKMPDECWIGLLSLTAMALEEFCTDMKSGGHVHGYDAQVPTVFQG